MGKFKNLLIELDLNVDQCKDPQIKNFIIDYAIRKQSNKWFQYKNGNAIIEINKNNGTSIRTILTDEDYKPEFPENIDMEISKKCINNCSFCYAGCTPEGKHADIKKFIEDKNSFLYTLREGTELALNGNEPLHPDLELLLQFCKERNILANLTVNENTLRIHAHQLEKWLQGGLIHGLGISPNSYSRIMFDFIRKYSSCVIHTIAGITTPQQYQAMKNNNLKILILGYKDFGRGQEYQIDHNETIKSNIQWLKNNVKDLLNHFQLISFDNLAIEQLNPREWLNKNQWNSFYRGDDGNHTLFVNLVDETYAKNSIQNKENHNPLLNNISEMLKNIKK